MSNLSTLFIRNSKQLCILLVLLSILSSAHAQGQKLQWGKFSSYPARNAIEKAPPLTEVDAKMLALALIPVPFDAPRFSRERSFSSYFGQYNAAKDEFERNRLVNSIKNKFESKQQELLRVGQFTTMVSGQLGEYSFDKKGFPLSISPNSNMVTTEGDLTVFPEFVYFNEHAAEKIVKSNPSHRVDVILVIKPTTGYDFLYANWVPLKARAVFSVLVIPENGQVIAVFPSEKSINDEIVKQLKGLLSIHLQFDENSYWYMQDSSAASKLMQTIQARTDQRHELGFGISPRVDSLQSAISQFLQRKRDAMNSILSSQRTYTGKAEEEFGNYTVKIHFLTFDSSSGRFSGELEWQGAGASNAVTKIEGKLLNDLFGPTMTFNEIAAIIPGGHKLVDGFSLRIRSNGELYGNYKSTTWGMGSISFQIRP